LGVCGQPPSHSSRSSAVGPAQQEGCQGQKDHPREGVKDHIIPHLAGKKTAKEMWTAIIGLYQGTSEARKLVLRDKLRNIKMGKSEPVVSDLTRFTQVKEELAGVGETVPYRDMVNFALLGFSKSWENFIDEVSGRETLPDWERLWSDCVQEEIRK
jgi:hypothetical protein